MSDETLNKFQINIDPGPPLMAYVVLPIGTYIEDKENGVALVHGKLKEAEAHLSRFLIKERQKKMTITPGVILRTGSRR